MPHKPNAGCRHHIPKMSFKVQKWPAHEAGLRRRGSLTLWIEDAALEDWQTTGPGGQARYTDAAIQTSLMLRTAFKLALRQTEGLMASILTLVGLTISAPDHTTVSRRAVTLPMIPATSLPQGPLHVLVDSTGLQVCGAGQWLEAKHGATSRRTWRKLHLAVDAASGMIVAQTLTDQDIDDPSQVGPLLDQIDEPTGRVTADGAYDGRPAYRMIAAHGGSITVVIPPRSTAVRSGEPGSPTKRDRHLAMIEEQGRLAWQAATGCGQRSLLETTMGRCKALTGPRLRARGFAAQQTEAAVGLAVLNQMLASGLRPSPAGHGIAAWDLGPSHLESVECTSAHTQAHLVQARVADFLVEAHMVSGKQWAGHLVCIHETIKRPMGIQARRRLAGAGGVRLREALSGWQVR